MQYLQVIHLNGECFHRAMLEPKTAAEDRIKDKDILSTP
jgi:hypothetical protein